MTAALGSWSDLTPEWLTAVLAARCPGAVVEKVTIGAIGEGTSSRAIVAIGYARGGGPPSVFVKLQGRLLHRLALVALRAFAAEALLADAGVELPLDWPRPYGGALDWRRLASVVVTDDVALDGGRPNVATRALGVEEVASGLEALARLHAAFWDRPLPASLGFLRPWRLGGSWAAVSALSLRRGLRRLQRVAGAPPSPPGATATVLERQFRQSAALAASGPQTLLHGDPHPGNTYALPEHRTGFYDWQLVRLGNWSHDVGYFLVGALDVPARREHERELLAGYLRSLRHCGVEAPSGPEAWERYRASPAFGLATWLHTLSFGRLHPDEVCLATIRRFGAAYEDLTTLRSPLLAG